MKLFAVLFMLLCSISAYGIEVNIVEDFKKPTVKRSVRVVLDQKVTAEYLKELAINIKNSDPVQYQRTFIGYL
jgi:hypothetical protein